MKKTCKSIFRRTLSFVVTAAMCLSLLPGAVFAGNETEAVPNETAENSLVQVDKATDEQTEDSEEVTEPDDADLDDEGEGETKEEVKTEESNPDEGEDKGENQQPDPAEGDENTDLGEGGDDTAEPGEGEGKEDSEDKTDSKEEPSEEEEKEEVADHVHNEDGWSCVWSECVHDEHGPECYVPGEDGEEDVLDCKHECGEDCLANTEGFWICTEPETPVYATVEELEAAFEAVGEVLESGDIQAGIDALDAYLAVYNRLSPEDQEENAEAFAAAMAYQETLKGSLEGIPDPDIETLAYAWRTVTLRPTTGLGITTKVSVGDTVTSYNGQNSYVVKEIKTQYTEKTVIVLNVYANNNSNFYFPKASDLWNIPSGKQVDYVSWSGNNSGKMTENGSGMCSNGAEGQNVGTGVYYFKNCSHSYSQTKAPTCTKKGEKICSKCGNVADVPVLGHNFPTTWTDNCTTHTDATCTGHTQVCTRCHGSETGGTQTKSHSYGAWVTVTEAQPGVKGLKKRTCTATGCGHYETQDIEALKTSTQTVTLGVHFTKDTSAGSTKMPELSDIPSNFQLSYSYTDADNITRTATLNVSSANKWLDGDANNCPTLTWAPFKVKVAEGSPVIITLKESNYLIGDNASEFIWTRSSSVNGGKMEEGTGQVKVIYAGWDRNTKAYAFNYYKQPDVDNPKLTGITKELVGATVNGETADINNLSVTKGDVVVLRYQITVKGEKNAKYIVTDDDVTVVSGSLEGTIGDSGEAVIIVTKTATANEVGTLNVTNTAYVKPKDEGTDPIPEDPAKPDDPDKGHPSDEVKTDIPVNEPNPKLTGIEKKLVSPEEPVTVKRGESVELVYEITVTGEKGAKYEVSDPEASDTTWKGIIDESGKAVITVTKTFTPTDEQKGTVTVKNTAYVKPNGEGTDPIKPEDPDKDPTDPEKGYPSNEVETEITIEEPNPKLKSIVKELVTPEPVTVKVGESVTLEYTITITGDEGAEYKVTDDGADLKEGSWDGKLGESGEAVIIVTKTVTPTEAGTLTVTNTALVSPGEGTDPIKPVDPENPDAPVDPEPSNTVTTDITVTEENEITITWLLGYGDNEVYGDIAKAPAGTKEVDSDLYPENNPTRPGYTFTGWGNPVIDPITGNITITAQWRQNTPTNPDPTDPTPTDPDPDPTPDSDPDPDPDPDPTPVRRVTVNAPDEPTPLANIADTPVPLAAPSDLIDIFDDDVPLAGGAQTGNNDALWYLLAALSLAGLGVLKLLEKKNTTK